MRNMAAHVKDWTFPSPKNSDLCPGGGSCESAVMEQEAWFLFKVEQKP